MRGEQGPDEGRSARSEAAPARRRPKSTTLRPNTRLQPPARLGRQQVRGAGHHKRGGEHCRVWGRRSGAMEELSGRARGAWEPECVVDRELSPQSLPPNLSPHTHTHQRTARTTA